MDRWEFTVYLISPIPTEQSEKHNEMEQINHIKFIFFLGQSIDHLYICYDEMNYFILKHQIGLIHEIRESQ